MIAETVRHAGGGLLMYLDADDLVDRRMVELARAALRPRHLGGLVAHGLMLDFRTLSAVPLPHPRVHDGAFAELCGSSTVARIDPPSPSLPAATRTPRWARTISGPAARPRRGYRWPACRLGAPMS